MLTIDETISNLGCDNHNMDTCTNRVAEHVPIVHMNDDTNVNELASRSSSKNEIVLMPQRSGKLQNRIARLAQLNPQ
jgi:hypothetical protein